MSTAIEVSIRYEAGEYIVNVRLAPALAHDAGRCVHVREAIGRRVTAALAAIAPGTPLARASNKESGGAHA